MRIGRSFLAPTVAMLQACASPGPLPPCIAPDALVRLDHAIVVVRDLDSASSRLASLGFRFKAGRLHPDGLLNRHIKFRDGTSLEVMTVTGTPGSVMARDYATLLQAGDGGAYAALWTDHLDSARRVAGRFGAPRESRSGAWQFLTLPNMPDARALFVGAGPLPTGEPDSLVSHPNGATSLASVWLVGGPMADSLLSAWGAVACGAVDLPDGRRGSRWGLSHGSVVVVRGGGRGIVGVELMRGGASDPELLEPLAGFWILVR